MSFHFTQDPHGYFEVRARFKGGGETAPALREFLYARPCRRQVEGILPPTPCHAVHRLVCWWAKGPPPSAEQDDACHFCCDNKQCLNPRHLRWGTKSQNRFEDWAIKKFKQKFRFKKRPMFHPTAWMLSVDGFPIKPAEL